MDSSLLHSVPAGDGQRIVVGLSGGVDSAVSAWLLKARGWDVIGLFMKNWEDDDDSEYCSTRQDWLDAASVADVIGVDLEAVNFAAEYRDRVFAAFLSEYSAGRTPNPDVLCNAEIKFKAFLDHAMRLGAARIATGHYAGTRPGADGQVQLLRGADAGKDQSYFLHRLNQAQIARVVFPLARIQKSQVRAIAAELALPNATKRDSTGICFIGERPFREFLGRYLPTKPGPMVDDRGQVIGEHIGLAFYTLGQRKGIGVGGRRDDTGEPWYVAGKDIERNALMVVRGHEHPWLQSSRLEALDASWVGAAPQPGRPYGIKTRYRQLDADGVIVACGEGRVRIGFDRAQRAVTPGQSAVVYDGDVCLGGGIIASTERTPLEEKHG